MASSSTIGSSSATVVTSGNTTYVASTASGLDTNSLVNAAVAQKTAAADALDAQVTANKTKISAYDTLQGLVNDVITSLTPLAATTFSSTATSNDFDAKSTTLTASDGSPASNYLAVDADSDATTSSYDIAVKQLAKAMKIGSSAMDAASPLGLSGTITLGTQGGATASIALTSDMTLQDLSNALAAQSATTGVNATVIEVSDGSAMLALSGADTDQTITLSASDNSILTGLGLTKSDGSFANVLQAPQDAEATVDGTLVTRSSNEWDDVIPGLSLSLLQTTAPGAAITVGVSPDVSAVKTDIGNFVSSYNKLRSFVAAQQTVNADGSISSDAVLFADTLLRSLSQSFSSLLNAGSPSAAGDITHLSDLGVTFADDDTLVSPDGTTLDNALLSDFSAVSSFFQSSFTTSNSALKLLQNTAVSSVAFTMHVDVDGSGTITDVLANGQPGDFTVSGNRIVGVQGTPYQGLAFALVAGSSTDIDVSLQQGFANTAVNLLSAYGDTSSGSIEQQIASLDTTDSDLSAQSTDIRNDAENYRQSLIDKYAQMETEVSSAQLVQKQIEAILGTSSSSGS